MNVFFEALCNFLSTNPFFLKSVSISYLYYVMKSPKNIFDILLYKWKFSCLHLIYVFSISLNVSQLTNIQYIIYTTYTLSHFMLDFEFL